MITYAIVAARNSRVLGQICAAPNANPEIINALNSIEGHIGPCRLCPVYQATKKLWNEPGKEISFE